MKILVVIFIFFLSSLTFANHIGTELESFNPSGYNSEFFSLVSTEVLNKKEWAAQFHISSFDIEIVNKMTNAQLFMDSLVLAHMGLNYGLSKKFTLGVETQMIVASNPNVSSGLVTHSHDSFNNIRIHGSYKLMSKERYSLKGYLALDQSFTKNNYFLGEDPGPSIVAVLAADYSLSSDAKIGFNLGYIMRNAGAPISPAFPVIQSDAILASVGVSKYYNQLGFTAELTMSSPVSPNNTGIEDGMTEINAGVQYKVNSNILLKGGGGTGIGEGRSPDSRFVIGAVLKFGETVRSVAGMGTGVYSQNQNNTYVTNNTYNIQPIQFVDLNGNQISKEQAISIYGKKKVKEFERKYMDDKYSHQFPNPMLLDELKGLSPEEQKRKLASVIFQKDKKVYKNFNANKCIKSDKQIDFEFVTKQKLTVSSNQKGVADECLFKNAPMKKTLINNKKFTCLDPLVHESRMFPHEKLKDHKLVEIKDNDLFKWLKVKFGDGIEYTKYDVMIQLNGIQSIDYAPELLDEIPEVMNCKALPFKVWKGAIKAGKNKMMLKFESPSNPFRKYLPIKITANGEVSKVIIRVREINERVYFSHQLLDKDVYNLSGR